METLVLSDGLEIQNPRDRPIEKMKPDMRGRHKQYDSLQLSQIIDAVRRMPQREALQALGLSWKAASIEQHQPSRRGKPI